MATVIDTSQPVQAFEFAASMQGLLGFITMQRLPVPGPAAAAALQQVLLMPGKFTGRVSLRRHVLL